MRQLVRAVSVSNVITRFCGKEGSLSTTKRRAAYLSKNFTVVRPVEYIIRKERTCSAVYVPINEMIQKMLNREDILDKALPLHKHVPHEYSTYRDGPNCKENNLLKGEEFRIAVGLYTDDFEVSNPLGTSKKKHKLNAVYWVLSRHSSPGEPANKNIKKAKKGELNYLPNFPDRFDQTGLEDARKILVDEMQKRTPNGQLVKEKMDLTFALRRKEVVETEPAITQIVEWWPALFMEDQVCPRVL